MDSGFQGRFIRSTLFCLCLLGWVVFLFRVVFPATLPFWLGLGVAFVLKPAALFLSRCLGIRRRKVAFVLLMVFYLLAGLLLWACGAALIAALADFFQYLPALFTDTIQPFFHQCALGLGNLLSRFSPPAAHDLAEKYTELIQGLAGSLGSLSAKALSAGTAVAGKVPFWLLTVVFSVFCSVLISLDYSQVTSALLKPFPHEIRQLLLRCRAFLGDTLLKLLRAYAILGLITFGELWLGFFLLGISRSAALGALFAVLDFLPLLGTGIFLVPWGLLELMAGHLTLGAGLLILYGIISVVRQALEPALVGNSVGLPPLVTLTAMYAGMSLLGFWGLLAAPAVLMLLLFLRQELSRRE